MVEELPHTIQIKSSQVHHTSDAEAKTEVGLDVIVDQHCACVRNHANRLDKHVERMDMMDEHTSNEIVRVMNWVTEQSKANEMVLLKDKVEKVEIDMSAKVSYYEMEEKIAVKVS